MKRVILAVWLVAAFALFFGMGFEQYLTLDALKANRAEFAAMLERHPWQFTLGAFMLYVTVAALSMPGATLMTLLIGALFGLFYGTLLVSFASTLGATIAFLVSRYALHDFVRQRFGDRMRVIDAGMEKEGVLYLFMLRLAPVFPFFLINLVMGLTQIRTRTFCWVSQLGMLAGTLMYVNAGTQLARIERLSDIVSPAVLLSLALLGVFPLAAKRIVRAIRA